VGVSPIFCRHSYPNKTSALEKNKLGMAVAQLDLLLCSGFFRLNLSEKGA
jgi:hypothetical protein